MVEFLLLVIAINTTMMASIFLESRLSEERKIQEHLQHDKYHHDEYLKMQDDSLRRAEEIQRRLNQENLENLKRWESEDE